MNQTEDRLQYLFVVYLRLSLFFCSCNHQWSGMSFCVSNEKKTFFCTRSTNSIDIMSCCQRYVAHLMSQFSSHSIYTMCVCVLAFVWVVHTESVSLQTSHIFFLFLFNTKCFSTCSAFSMEFVGVQNFVFAISSENVL